MNKKEENIRCVDGPKKGIWRLVDPDGIEFLGATPLRCVKAEIDHRVPPHIQLKRIFESLDEELSE